MVQLWGAQAACVGGGELGYGLHVWWGSGLCMWWRELGNACREVEAGLCAHGERSGLHVEGAGVGAGLPMWQGGSPRRMCSPGLWPVLHVVPSCPEVRKPCLTESE